MRVTQFDLDMPTEDLKRCLEFYVEGLLFTKLWEFPESCTVALDGFHLTFRKASRKHVEVMRQMDYSFSLRLGDIQNYYERVRATGKVKFEQELELMQPGVWQFWLFDCNGYRVGFAMP